MQDARGEMGASVGPKASLISEVGSWPKERNRKKEVPWLRIEVVPRRTTDNTVVQPYYSIVCSIIRS